MRLSRTKARGALVALLLAAGPLATAEDTSDDAYTTEFVVGNLVFVLFHEFSHLVIEDFEVPVLGNNEDAADTLAAVSLIRMDRNRPEGDFRFIRMLLTAADANRILWQRGLEQDNPIIYLANHPLSVQRAARIACLAYGSEPELLEPLPEIVGLPDFRADWCEEEFEAAEEAWLWVRDNYVRTSPGAASGHTVAYGPTNDPRSQSVREKLVKARLLERTIELAENSMLLREDITLLAQTCGVPNAYWDGNERELVVCYDLIEAFYGLADDQSIRELEEKIREFHRDQGRGTKPGE